jgi:pimeloyl-ACP methyl ester carboxylesterase
MGGGGAPQGGDASGWAGGAPQGGGAQGGGFQGGGPQGGGGADRAALTVSENVQATDMTIGFGVQAVLYEPKDPGEKAAIAIVVMHSDSDYTRFHMGNDMAERGYTVLCANVSSAEADLDQKIQDLKSVVQSLREDASIRKVVLMGHSGGGTLMTAYQAIAENGPGVFQGPGRVHQAPDSLAGLPPADGIMLLDSNWGNATMMLLSLDPAVKDERSGLDLDQSLNLWNPDNGFTPGGSSFSQAFIAKFYKAQGERNNRIVDGAMERLELMNAGKGYFTDDEPLVIPGGDQSMFSNKLYAQDVSLLAHTKGAWPLLKPDGSVSVEVVHSVRNPTNDNSLTGSYGQGALRTTVKNFLASHAIKVFDDYCVKEDGVYGVDYDSSYSCPPGNVQAISAPLLAAGMTGSWEYLAAEAIYENAKSEDKTIVFVEGAGHTFTTATDTESVPGEWGDTKKTLYDYVDAWLSEGGRFS